MKISVYNYLNIDQLCKSDRDSLLKAYHESYKNSIWATKTFESVAWYGTKASEKWFLDALDLYIDLAMKEGCELILTQDNETGEIIAVLFAVNERVFLENADTSARENMEIELQKMGADPGKTIYIGELFVAPNYRGLTGGVAIFEMVLKLQEQMLLQGMQYVIVWTLDRMDNNLTKIYRKIGLQVVSNGKTKNGIDIVKLKGDQRAKFSIASDGPVLYFFARVDQVCNFLSKFSRHKS